MKAGILAVIIGFVALVSKGVAQTKSEFERAVVIEPMRNRSLKTTGGDWDDKRDVVSFRVKFTNTDLRKSFDGHEGELFVFAESILDRRAFKLIIKEKFSVAVPSRGAFEFASTEAVTQWDNTGVRFGARYDSWALIVKDHAGVVVARKASIPAWLPVLEKMSDLQVSHFYDRTLKPVESVR